MKWFASILCTFFGVAFWAILEAFATISQAGAWETSHTVGAAMVLPLLLAHCALALMWAFAEWEEN